MYLVELWERSKLNLRQRLSHAEKNYWVLVKKAKLTQGLSGLGKKISENSSLPKELFMHLLKAPAT